MLPLAALAVGAVSIVLRANAVCDKLTDVDRQAIHQITRDIPPPPAARTYEQEIELIVDVQRAVINVSSESKGIPEGQSREPADLLQRRAGLCYDRSRTIEKSLRYYGFQVRHLAIFKESQQWPKYINTLMGHSWSHAMSEVLTKNGWLIVDSNAEWISMDTQGLPVSIRQLQDHPERLHLIADGAAPNYLLNSKFIYVYGLYSRHGRFYPPYTPIPDINYTEFYQNLSEIFSSPHNS